MNAFLVCFLGEKFITGITLGRKIQLAYENDEFKPGANA